MVYVWCVGSEWVSRKEYKLNGNEWVSEWVEYVKMTEERKLLIDWIEREIKTNNSKESIEDKVEEEKGQRRRTERKGKDLNARLDTCNRTNCSRRLHAWRCINIVSIHSDIHWHNKYIHNGYASYLANERVSERVSWFVALMDGTQGNHPRHILLLFHPPMFPHRPCIPYFRIAPCIPLILSIIPNNQFSQYSKFRSRPCVWICLCLRLCTFNYTLDSGYIAIAVASCHHCLKDNALTILGIKHTLTPAMWSK